MRTIRSNNVLNKCHATLSACVQIRCNCIGNYSASRDTTLSKQNLIRVNRVGKEINHLCGFNGIFAVRGDAEELTRLEVIGLFRIIARPCRNTQFHAFRCSCLNCTQRVSPKESAPRTVGRIRTISVCIYVGFFGMFL